MWPPKEFATAPCPSCFSCQRCRKSWENWKVGPTPWWAHLTTWPQRRGRWWVGGILSAFACWFGRSFKERAMEWKWISGPWASCSSNLFWNSTWLHHPSKRQASSESSQHKFLYERSWLVEGKGCGKQKPIKNIFNSLGRTLTPKYTHRILDLHCDIEVCGYLPFGTNLVEPLGMLSWHCPYLAPPQSGLVRCSSIGWIQRFNLLILAWSYWIGSEGTEVEMTCEDLQFAIWILLDVFFWSHPSDCNWVAFWHLLRRQVCSAVFAWEVEVPISLQGGGKGISQVKESALSWGVSVKTLFIPWPYSILPIWPTWYVSFWILRARLVWAESKKGLFSYPKRNLDLSGWWFFPPNQRDSAVLLEPFFAWHFFCMAKNRMRLAETSSRVFWRNQCLWCLTVVDGEDVWCIS